MSPPTSGRRSGTLLPLWSGLLSALLFALLWWSGRTPAAEPPLRADWGPMPSADEPLPETPAAVASLRWRVEGRAQPSVAALGACLRQALPEQRPLVLEEGAHLLLSFSGLARPLQLRAEAAAHLELRSPIFGDRRTLLSAHVAAAGCLRVEGAHIEDDLLERRYTFADWPQLQPGGGVAAELFVRVAHLEGGFARTQGLARLAQFDLGVAAQPTPAGRAAAEHFLLQAAAAQIAAAQPEQPLQLPKHPALTPWSVAQQPEWPAEATPAEGEPPLRVLGSAAQQIYRVPAEPTARAPQQAPPPKAPATRPAQAPPKKRPAQAPASLPDYR